MGRKSAAYRAGMNVVQQAQQPEQQAEESASTAEELVGVFTSKKGVPTTSKTGNVRNPQDDDTNEGILGNVRKTLFSGGVSSGGGVFTYGKRKTDGLFNKIFF